MSVDPQAAGWERHEVPEGFVSLLGPIWRQAEGEALRFAIVAGRSHLNSAGTIHGGFLITFADQALGWLVRNEIKETPRATVQLDIHFLHPARPGDLVEASGRVVRRTRSMVFMRGGLSVGSQAVLAAHGIWKLRSRDRPTG